MAELYGYKSLFIIVRSLFSPFSMNLDTVLPVLVRIVVRKPEVICERLCQPPHIQICLVFLLRRGGGMAHLLLGVLWMPGHLHTARPLTVGKRRAKPHRRAVSPSPPQLLGARSPIMASRG